MAAPTTSAPDLVHFTAFLIGSNHIEAKGDYEAATDYLFIRSAYVPVVSMIFDAPQIHALDSLKSNFSLRVPKSNASQNQVITSMPVNQLLRIAASISASSYDNRVSLKYNVISFESKRPDSK